MYWKILKYYGLFIWYWINDAQQEDSLSERLELISWSFPSYLIILSFHSRNVWHFSSPIIGLINNREIAVYSSIFLGFLPELYLERHNSVNLNNFLSLSCHIDNHDWLTSRQWLDCQFAKQSLTEFHHDWQFINLYTTKD